MSNPYQGLREQALKAADPGSGRRVYGALMDWPVGSGMATLFVLADGTASLYLTSGGGVIGGQAHLAVREAGLRFLDTLEPLLQLFQRDPASAPLPPADLTDLRALTTEGRMVGRAPTQLLGAGRSPLSPAFHAAQAVIAELRKVAEG